MSNAPWSDASEALVVAGAYTITLAVTLTATGLTSLPITVTDCAVTCDASRSPRWEATITMPWPSADVLAMLDPRRPGGVFVNISAGYAPWGSANDDTHRLVTLRLRSAARDWASNTITITATSDECIPIGYPIDAPLAFTTSSRLVDAIQQVIAAAFPGDTLTWAIGDNVQRGVTFATAPPTAAAVGQDRWNTVTDWADALAAVIYHDGAGVWHIDPADPVPGSVTTARLATGKRGTVSLVDDDYSLDGFGTAVAVIYTYSLAGVNKQTTAIATTGALPVTMLTVTKQQPPVDAAGVARQSLIRALRRGHTVTCEAAAFYWTRPGTAMTINLPDGSNDRLFVESVEFDLVAGTMRIEGQSPDQSGSPLVPSISTSVQTVNP